MSRMIYNYWLARQGDLHHFQVISVEQMKLNDDPNYLRACVKCLESRQMFHTVTKDYSCKAFKTIAYFSWWKDRVGEVVHVLPEVAAFDNISGQCSVSFQIVELDKSLTFNYGEGEYND